MNNTHAFRLAPFPPHQCFTLYAVDVNISLNVLLMMSDCVWVNRKAAELYRTARWGYGDRTGVGRVGGSASIINSLTSREYSLFKEVPKSPRSEVHKPRFLNGLIIVAEKHKQH